MKSRFTITSMIVFVSALGFSFSSSAQDTHTDNHLITIEIPTVALLDLEVSGAGTKDLTAAFTQPTPFEAGEKINAPVANTSLWLNYSSIQNTTKSKRVDVKTSTPVPGIDISLIAGTSATGGGTLGTPAGAAQVLSESAVTLISDIGSAYTETGQSKGHQLTYSFATSTAYSGLRSGNVPVTVTYTLVEN